MAMTYEQSAALMVDAAFRGRVRVACITYAAYILNEPPDVQGHSARMRWAVSAYQNPEFVATQAQTPTVMDPAIQAAGVDADGKSLASDGEVQSAVEAAVNKLV